jgi:hypothetical protein
MEWPYPPDVEQAMRAFFDSLPERQRRHYAAVESLKMGRGAVPYLAGLFDCDEKTIRRGRRELARPDPLPPGRSRKKGAGAGR